MWRSQFISKYSERDKMMGGVGLNFPGILNRFFRTPRHIARNNQVHG